MLTGSAVKLYTSVGTIILHQLSRMLSVQQPLALTGVYGSDLCHTLHTLLPQFREEGRA